MNEAFLLYLLGDPATTSRTDIQNNQNDIVAGLSHDISGRRPFTYLSTRQAVTDALLACAMERLQRPGG